VDHCPAAARGGGQEEKRFGVPKLTHVGSTAFRAENEERVVERITGRSGAREHRHAQHPLDRPAGTRIHDVRIREAPGLERLLGPAGHRQRTVLQLNGERDFSRVDRILDHDVPSAAAGRRAEPVDGAASGADQGGSDLPTSEQVDDTIDGVALGDASEVQRHAGLIEGDGLRCRIQHHMGAADVMPRCGELVVRWDAALASEEAPRLHERANGDVERTAGVSVIAHRVGNEVEQLRCDGDGMLRRLAVDA
jgi:hypothetical protein